MRKNIIKRTVLLLPFFLLLTGCSELEEGVKDLPENPSGEVTHNTFDDKSAFLSEQEPATLDEGFISQYIDVNAFGVESAWVQDNSSSVHSDFSSTDNNIEKDITENEKEYNKQKNSVDTNISTMQNNNTTNYNNDVSDINKDLQEKEDEYNDKVEDFTSEN